MAALTQGRNFLLRNVDKRTAESREELFGAEHESDFFLLMRAWRYADKANYNMDASPPAGHSRAGVAAAGGPAVRAIPRDRGGGEAPMSRRNASTAWPCANACCSVSATTSPAGSTRATLRCELVHKRRGLLSRESAVQEAPLLVAAEITEIESRGEVNTLLGLCTAIEEAWLKELFPEDFHDAGGVAYDETQRRVLARKERRFRDLVLESKQTAGEPPEGEAAAILAREVMAGRIVLTEWTEAVEHWITRVNCLAKWWPELEVHPITDADRTTLIEQICYGSHGARELKDKPVMPILRDWLLPEQLAVLDEYLPERIEMANGRKARVTYSKDGPPVLSARIQELYGVDAKFTLGHGRVPVKIEVLAPNQRPIQVTDDLSNFWREQYSRRLGARNCSVATRATNGAKFRAKARALMCVGGPVSRRGRGRIGKIGSSSTAPRQLETL